MMRAFCAKISRQSRSTRSGVRSRDMATSERTWRFLRSTLKSSSRPGRCTLTATRVPFLVVARCTWPRDAAASGVSSNSAKASSPSSSRRIRFTSDSGKGGHSSCSVESSSMKTLGITSTRVERSCPSLMKVGPSASSPSLHSRASLVLASTSPSFPWRAGLLIMFLTTTRVRKVHICSERFTMKNPGQLLPAAALTPGRAAPPRGLRRARLVSNRRGSLLNRMIEFSHENSRADEDDRSSALSTARARGLGGLMRPTTRDATAGRARETAPVGDGVASGGSCDLCDQPSAMVAERSTAATTVHRGRHEVRLL
mmetsp:Transcript_15946/g.42966  ORF Transcript_15946/g.42966 Transcript_15946/m.42966 type:complete len:313 (-) Transcript_15946:34-972(-)